MCVIIQSVSLQISLVRILHMLYCCITAVICVLLCRQIFGIHSTRLSSLTNKQHELETVGTSKDYIIFLVIYGFMVTPSCGYPFSLMFVLMMELMP